MVYEAGDGHIPSAFSIVDIINAIYDRHLRFDPQNPEWPERDYFILSKGHGCLALYVVLEKHGFISEYDLNMFSKKGGILGEHPDATKVPGIEASTGSLGHGFPFAMGIALGLRLRNMTNKVCVLVGDGECHEGTVWEAANVANNLELGNLLVIVDRNRSAEQLMPKDDLPAKWRAFGWNTVEINGHSASEIDNALSSFEARPRGAPTVLIAETVKGRGVPMIEGHGPWHHRIPDEREMGEIMEALS